MKNYTPLKNSCQLEKLKKESKNLPKANYNQWLKRFLNALYACETSTLIGESYIHFSRNLQKSIICKRSGLSLDRVNYFLHKYNKIYFDVHYNETGHKIEMIYFRNTLYTFLKKNKDQKRHLQDWVSYHIYHSNLTPFQKNLLYTAASLTHTQTITIIQLCSMEDNWSPQYKRKCRDGLNAMTKKGIFKPSKIAGEGNELYYGKVIKLSTSYPQTMLRKSKPNPKSVVPSYRSNSRFLFIKEDDNKNLNINLQINYTTNLKPRCERKTWVNYPTKQGPYALVYKQDELERIWKWHLLEKKVDKVTQLAIMCENDNVSNQKMNQFMIQPQQQEDDTELLRKIEILKAKRLARKLQDERNIAIQGGFLREWEQDQLKIKIYESKENEKRISMSQYQNDNILPMKAVALTESKNAYLTKLKLTPDEMTMVLLEEERARINVQVLKESRDLVPYDCMTKGKIIEQMEKHNLNFEMYYSKAKGQHDTKARREEQKFLTGKLINNNKWLRKIKVCTDPDQMYFLYATWKADLGTSNGTCHHLHLIEKIVRENRKTIENAKKQGLAGFLNVIDFTNEYVNDEFEEFNKLSSLRMTRDPKQLAHNRYRKKMDKYIAEAARKNFEWENPRLFPNIKRSYNEKEEADAVFADPDDNAEIYGE
jgi:hypothetical protein